MKFNLLICDDNDKVLLDETFDNSGDAILRLTDAEYEYEARMDNLTGGDNE